MKTILLCLSACLLMAGCGHGDGGGNNGNGGSGGPGDEYAVDAGNNPCANSGHSECYSYEYTVNGVSTGRHTFYSLSDYCAGLQNNQLNNGVAGDQRAQDYQKYCVEGRSFQAPVPDSVPDMPSMPQMPSFPTDQEQTYN